MFGTKKWHKWFVICFNQDVFPQNVIGKFSQAHTDCSRDNKAGDYEGHDCVPSLTPEEKQAAGLLKRAISTSPEKGIIQLPTEGTVK